MKKLYLSILAPTLMTLMTVMTAPAWAGVEVEERYPLSPDGEVTVEMIAGTITITGWDNNEVLIQGTLGDGTKGLDISAEGDEIDISVELERGHKNIQGSDLHIQIPRGCEIEVETISAPVEVIGITGAVALESISGTITIHSSPEEAEIATVSGTIVVKTDSPLREGEFESVSGTVKLDSAIHPEGSIDIETVSGTVVLYLTSDTSADFEISSFSGTIKTDFGVQPSQPNEYLPSQELTFTLGGGDAEISVETISGTVKLIQK